MHSGYTTVDRLYIEDGLVSTRTPPVLREWYLLLQFRSRFSQVHHEVLLSLNIITEVIAMMSQKAEKIIDGIVIAVPHRWRRHIPSQSLGTLTTLRLVTRASSVWDR